MYRKLVLLKVEQGTISLSVDKWKLARRTSIVDRRIYYIKGKEVILKNEKV